MTGLRVGLVTRQYPPDSLGGIGTYVGTVAAVLAAHGHEPVVIHTVAGQRRETTWDDGVRVERFPAVGPDRLWAVTTKLSMQLTERVRAALSAFRALRRLSSFDVIEAPEWKAEGLLLRWARRGPIVVHLHLLDRQVMAATGVRPGLGRRAANVLELRSTRWAAGVTASSWSSLYGPDGAALLDAARVRLVTPPLRPGSWADVGSVATTDPVVLYLGRLEPLKAPEILVQALASLPPIPGLRVVFVGRPYEAAHGEPYDRYLRRLADAAGLDYEILAPITDGDRLRALLSRARVVAVPSRFETLSMVTLEAMAAGRPVVMGSRVGMAEWVTDPSAAPAVDVDDIAGWATHLSRFLTDPEAATAAGACNRARALELTAPERIVASRLDVYREAMSRTGRRRRRGSPPAGSDR